jgi:ABC-type Mn2+/Zn2+ transport system permease subunit
MRMGMLISDIVSLASGVFLLRRKIAPLGGAYGHEMCGGILAGSKIFWPSTGTSAAIHGD